MESSSIEFTDANALPQGSDSMRFPWVKDLVRTKANPGTEGTEQGKKGYFQLHLSFPGSCQMIKSVFPL